jgi:hypothetical protein
MYKGLYWLRYPVQFGLYLCFYLRLHPCRPSGGLVHVISLHDHPLTRSHIAAVSTACCDRPAAPRLDS